MTWDTRNPVYNVSSAALTTHRRKAWRGLKSLTREQRQAYGQAVEDAVRAAQWQWCPRPAPEEQPCRDIGARTRAAQSRALLNYPGKVRRGRDPATWRTMYEYAMREKREREREAA